MEIRKRKYLRCWDTSPFCAIISKGKNKRLCRFCLCVVLIRGFGFGPMGVWIGMFADWTVRAVVFTYRFRSRKWMEHQVI